MRKISIKNYFAVLVLFFLLPIHAQAIVINSGSVKFDPKKSDSFQVAGNFTNLSLNGVQTVTFEFGSFSQTIPLSSFLQKNDIYKFKAAKGAAGISSMDINLKKNSFSAKAANLVLLSLKNPLAIRLSAGAFDECSMPQFTETEKSWKFSGKKGIQSPCKITDVPQADPNAFFINTPTEVRVQARIAPDPQLNKNTVELFEVNASTLAPIGKVCDLKDDGNLDNGDDIAGDSVFSCIETFNESTPGKIKLIVQASLNTKPIFSPSFTLDVVPPLSQASVSEVINDQQAAEQIWQTQLTAFGDTPKARSEAVKQIKVLPGVENAGISNDGVTIWIKYESGLTGGLMLNPDGTRGGHSTPGSRSVPATQASPSILPALFYHNTINISNSSNSSSAFSSSYGGFAKTALLQDDDNTPVGNSRVLIWDAYNSQFAPFDEGPGLQQLFQGSQCPKYDVTYLKDNQATVNSVKDFSQFGTVILVTHGAVDGDGQVVFLTSETANLVTMQSHALDLVLGRLTVMGNVFAIRPGFISSLSGVFEDSIVYNGSCQSSGNNTMANAFSGKGAKTYYGFTKVVNSNFAKDVAMQLFGNLVTSKKNTGDAFSPVTPKVDPAAPFATFAMAGDGKVAYSGEFKNGGFETGNLSGWRRDGDGRVVSALGEFSPVEGAFMGIISTGLGFTDKTGSIEQSFCLPQTATQVKFNWNFSSEEFTEYCDSDFDDSFDVQLITDAGSNTLFHTSINKLCEDITRPIYATGLTFDRSGIYCETSEFETDCTVGSTDWVSQTVDISAIALANAGKGVKLKFISGDVGDSIFDSAILLDDIQIVTP